MKKIFFLFVFMAAVMLSCDGFYTEGGDNEVVVENDTVVDEAVECDTLEEVEAVEDDTLVQCAAITKKGTQCERLVNPQDTYCFQHKNRR